MSTGQSVKAAIERELDLTPAVVEEIRGAACAGRQAIPGHGIEIGGILTCTNGGAIDGVHHVVCEYRFGPTYRLSENDLLAFRAAVADAEQHHTVIGFFRSSTRGTGAFRPDDLDVVRDLDDRCRLVVIAAVVGIQRCSFRVFRRIEESSEWSVAQEFDAEPWEELPVTPSQPSQPPLVKPHKPTVVSVPRPAPRKQPASRLYFAIATGLAILILIAAAVRILPLISIGKSGSAVQPSDLGLRVESQGSRLRVSWNRQSHTVQQANSGKLTIHDGPKVWQLDLGAAELTSGSVVYPPNSNDVLFELRVLGPGAPVVESVRVLDQVRSDTEPLPAGAVLKRNLPTAPDRPEPGRSDQFVGQPEASETARRTFTPPPSTTRTVPPLILLPAPSATVPGEFGGRTARNQALLQIETQTPQVAPRPPLPGQASGEGPDVQPTAPAKPVAALVVTPPVPLRQPAPNLRTLGIPPVYRAVDVSVVVRIDTNGRVISASPETHDPSVNLGLVAASVSAAKQWTFRPARSGGHPVPASHTIVFHFAPAQ